MRLEVLASCVDGGATPSVAGSVLVELLGVRRSAFQVASSVVLNEDGPTCCSTYVGCPKPKAPLHSDLGK